MPRNKPRACDRYWYPEQAVCYTSYSLSWHYDIILRIRTLIQYVIQKSRHRSIINQRNMLAENRFEMTHGRLFVDVGMTLNEKMIFYKCLNCLNF